MNNKEAEFIMLVGLPGSGKSTWTGNERFRRWPNIVVISTDDYIERMAAKEGKTYTQVFDKYIKEATRQMEVDLLDAVSKRRDIIWDQTNLTVKSRKNKLSKIPDCYLKRAINFKCRKDVLGTRLEQRFQSTGKFIPAEIMESMGRSFQAATTAEGFEQVDTIDTSY